MTSNLQSDLADIDPLSSANLVGVYTACKKELQNLLICWGREEYSHQICNCVCQNTDFLCTHIWHIFPSINIKEPINSLKRHQILHKLYLFKISPKNIPNLWKIDNIWHFCLLNPNITILKLLKNCLKG